MNETAFVEQGERSLEQVRSMEITDQATYEVAIAYTKVMKELETQIKEYWKEPKKKAFEAHKAVTAKEKEMLGPVERAEKLLRTKIGAYNAKLEEQRRKEEARLRDKARQKGLDDSLVTVEKPATMGVSYRDQWVWSVISFSSVPDEFKSINEALLNRIVRQDKGATRIPGIEVSCKKIPVIS